MKDLILLHGALGSSQQMEPLSMLLKENFRVHLITFSGHGGKTSSSPFTIPLFAGDVLKYIEENNITKPDIFGYSMGGYAALYLGLYHSNKINRVVTLATKFQWDKETALKEAQKLDPAIISEKVPAFSGHLKKVHSTDQWENVLYKTALMMEGLVDTKIKDDEFRKIENTCMLMVGDRDKMVSLTETETVYKLIPHSNLAVLPGTSHPFEQCDVEMVAFLLDKFLKH